MTIHPDDFPDLAREVIQEMEDKDYELTIRLDGSTVYKTKPKEEGKEKAK